MGKTVALGDVAVKLALDTNRYLDLMRGDAEVRAPVEGAQGRANERFLAAPGVVVVYATDAHFGHLARLDVV